MENPPVNEVPKTEPISVTQRLDRLIKENEAVRELFTKGIESHIENLETQNQSVADEANPNPEIIATSIARFNRLKEVISDKLADWKINVITTLPGHNETILRINKKENISENNPKYFARNEKPFEQVSVVIKKLEKKSGFNQNPADVLESGGYRMEIFMDHVYFDNDKDRPEFQSLAGYTVWFNKNGNVNGKATKFDGRTPYDSRRIHDFGEVPQAMTITNEIDNHFKHA